MSKSSKDDVPNGPTTYDQGTIATDVQGLQYTVEESPPWHLCLLLGFQVRTSQGWKPTAPVICDYAHLNIIAIYSILLLLRTNSAMHKNGNNVVIFNILL